MSTPPARTTPRSPNRMPTLGQDLLYTLSALDAGVITKRRAQSLASALAAEPGARPPVDSGADVHEGDVYPAKVVRVRSIDPEDALNLQVILDGTDTHWVERTNEGTGPGSWHWPGL